MAADQVAGDDEEDVHAGESTGDARCIGVAEHYAEDGQGAEAVAVRAIGPARLIGGAGWVGPGSAHARSSAEATALQSEECTGLQARQGANEGQAKFCEHSIPRQALFELCASLVKTAAELLVWRGELQVAEGAPGAVGRKVAAVDEEQALSVAISALGGALAESGFGIKQRHAGKMRGGLLQHGNGSGDARIAGGKRDAWV